MKRPDRQARDPTISPTIVAAIAAKLEAQITNLPTKDTRRLDPMPPIPDDFTKDDVLKIALRAHLPVDPNDSRLTLVEQITEFLSPEALRAQVERLQKQKAEQ